ncbi:hypothetical protein QUB70_12005 [Microcoleus sp. A003_D6]
MSTNDIGRTVPISRNLRAWGDILHDRPDKKMGYKPPPSRGTFGSDLSSKVFE